MPVPYDRGRKSVIAGADSELRRQWHARVPWERGKACLLWLIGSPWWVVFDRGRSDRAAEAVKRRVMVFDTRCLERGRSRGGGEAR